jgi:hypothetical protein
MELKKSYVYFFPLLCSSQEFTLNILLKKGPEYEDLALDSYVLLKVAAFVDFDNQWENNRLILVVMVLMLETVLYIPTLILHPICFRNRSYKDRCFCFLIISKWYLLLQFSTVVITI